MNLVALLEKMKSENVPVVVNGITGQITEIGEELLTLKIIRSRSEGKEKKLLEETVHIPIHNILTISRGEKEIPKSKEEENVERELEQALGKTG